MVVGAEERWDGWRQVEEEQEGWNTTRFTPWVLRCLNLAQAAQSRPLRHVPTLPALPRRQEGTRVATPARCWGEV